MPWGGGDAPRRALLIHFGQMGDAVAALPAAEALRAAFPRARWSVLAGLGGAGVFRLAGFEVWPVDRVAWRDHRGRGLVGVVALLRRLRAERFDLSVDLHSYKETNLLAWAAGIPERVAMLRPTRSWPRLINLPPPPDDPDGRLLDRYCRVLEPLGIAVPAQARRPRLTPPPGVLEEMRARLAAEAGAAGAAWDAATVGRGARGALLGVCPGAGHPSRRWPAELFAEVVAALAAEEAPWPRPVIFLGPEEDEARLRPLLAVAGARVERGLDLPRLAAALSLCRVVLTNASGPSHVAAAVGARVVTVGELPAFDPVGAVFPARARRGLEDIQPAAVLARLREAWNAPPERSTAPSPPAAVSP